jgi:hypothetical protein
MDAGNGKSRDFGLSQALANQVVQKGVCGDFILCGLSPPVSASWSLVHRYTLWNAQDRTALTKSGRVFIPAWRTRLWLLSGWGCRGRRLSRG